MSNQTIDGVRKLAEQACGTSPDSPAYRRFIAAMNPTLLLDLTAPADQHRGESVLGAPTCEFHQSADECETYSGKHPCSVAAQPECGPVMVLPERPRADEEEYDRMTDYEKGLLHGGIELWDKIDELIRLSNNKGV